MKEDRTATTATIPNGWFHLALSWNPTEGHYDLYLDGEQVSATGLPPHYALISGSSLEFGKRVYTTNTESIPPFDGAIDEVARTVEEAVRGAWLIVIAAPVLAGTAEGNHAADTWWGNGLLRACPLH
mgnify:CR=1 FL=1